MKNNTAGKIVDAYDFFIAIPILFLAYIILILQILTPVDPNYSDPRMEELCTKKVFSITDISSPLNCINYDINKKVISGWKIIKNMIP